MLTFLVKLVEKEPTMARFVTLPLNAESTELMKLDLPEPTGPRRRTLASVASAQSGLYEPMLFIRLVFCLRGSRSVLPLVFQNMIMHI